MGELLVKPSIDIKDIEFVIDKNSTDAENRLEWMGHLVPLIKFGTKVFTSADIIKFNISVSVYGLPKIVMTINDPDKIIRKYFKNNPNTGVCRIGFKNYAHKFNVIFDNERSKYTNTQINLSGYLWNMKMFQPINYSEFNISIKDFLTKLSTTVNNGFYYYSNNYIDKTIDNIIFSNLNYLEILQKYIDGFSDCFWGIDPNYYLHVGDYETLISQDVSVYTLNYHNGIPLDKEYPMIFYSNIDNAKISDEDLEYINPAPGKEIPDMRIPVVGYDVISESGLEFLQSSKSYTLNTDNDNFSLYNIIDPNGYGIGKSTTNTFSGFLSHPNPYFSEYKNKILGKKTINVYVNYLLPELNLFDVIDLRLYKRYKINDKDLADATSDTPELDTENSGKRLVIGYDIAYDMNKSYTTKAQEQIRYVIKCV